MEVDEDPSKLQPPSSANNAGCPLSFPHLVGNLQPMPSTTTVGAKTSTSTAMNATAAAGESSHQASTTSPRPIATTAATTVTGADERAADAGEEAGFKTAATSTRKESPPTTKATLLLTSTKFVGTQNISSRGDWPHEVRTSNMTISHLVEGSPRASSSNSGDMDALVVDMDTSEPPRRSSEDSDEGPINLATSREEAINLSRCNIRNSSPIVPSGGNSPMGMMSAKMRLKQKQRLEAVAKAASEMQRNIAPTSETNFYETTSALHRLANVAAERKQVSSDEDFRLFPLSSSSAWWWPLIEVIGREGQ